MPLIGHLEQQSRFEELVAQAHRIDIAVAWAGLCEAVDVLENCSAKLRVVVGIWGHNTNPDALDKLRNLDHVNLRVVPDDDPNQNFHPKYYCFHGSKIICWVGSTNLTVGGFKRNVELVSEFELEMKKDMDWFERLWNKLERDPTTLIKKYRERYQRQKARLYAQTRPKVSDLPLLEEVKTWDDYLQALHMYDAYVRHKEEFSVLGDSHSWLHTALYGRTVVRIEDWTKLSRLKCYVLRGLDTKIDDSGIWGFYGRLKGARQASYILNNDNMPEVMDCRTIIRKIIDSVLECSEKEIPTVAQRAVNHIGRIHRSGIPYHVGYAAPTRWLSLARPECLVSVIGPSKAMLSQASGLAQNSLYSNYSELVHWIQEQSWFFEQKRKPSNLLEQDIWECRAALIDVFTYTWW